MSEDWKRQQKERAWIEKLAEVMLSRRGVVHIESPLIAKFLKLGIRAWLDAEVLEEESRIPALELLERFLTPWEDDEIPF